MTATPTSPKTTPAPRVVVIGGGLAGMAAAVAIESAGLPVTLLEARATLGGRAGSFTDHQTGQPLDSSQHLLLGCCTNLISFYRRIGAAHLIRWERTIHFRDSAGQHDLWAMPGLPAPFHLAPSMAFFAALSIRQRLSLFRAMLSILRLPPEALPSLADITFGQWLDEHAQSSPLIDRFYTPLLISALNEQPRRANAAYAIRVFQTAMLSHASGYHLGLPACPLSDLYRNLPCRDIRLSTRARGLRFSGQTITGVELQNGQLLTADAFVFAINHHTLRKWVPPELAARDERLAHLDNLESVPILGAHLWFDRAIMAESHAALLDGPLQWVFRKDREGRALLGVISAARQWTDRPRVRCLAAFEDQIRRLFPAAGNASLQRGLIIVEKRATFSPLPGVDRYRPQQSPPPAGIENLFLAGDYTHTHWPATMEGAVRSGYLAADAVVARVHAATAPHRTFLVNDLPLQWPARLLAARP